MARKKKAQLDSIRIGYQSYEIESIRLPDTHVGECEKGQRGRTVIRVDDEQVGAELANTVLHEVFHGICKNYGPDNVSAAVEERFCSQFSNGMIQVIRDNPVFILWLVARINEG